MSQTVAEFGQRSRDIELETGEIVEGVRRITREDKSLAERKRLVEDSSRMRSKVSNRLMLHTDGPGHRVVYPEDIHERHRPEVAD